MQVLLAECKNYTVASDMGWDPLIEDTKTEETKTVFHNMLNKKYVLAVVSILPLFTLFYQGILKIAKHSALITPIYIHSSCKK